MLQRKACIIGCGAIFPVHADVLTRLEGVTLAAVADIKGERAERAAEKYHCRSYTDWQEMLLREKPDAVHICTPHYLHAPMAAFALDHGISALTEKPVALNPQDAQQIIRARDKSHLTAAVIFQNRLSDATVAMKRIIDGGEYGKVLSAKGIVAWHRDAAYYQDSGWRGKYATEGGGVLMNQSIHTLDLLQYLVGAVESVRAHVDTYVLNDVIEVEDTANAVLFFKNGARGLFYATTANLTDSPVEIEIILEKAKMVMRGEKVVLFHGDEEKELCMPSGAKNSYKGCWGTCHGRQIERFYRNLGRENTFVSIEDGTQVLRIIQAIYRASKSGAMATL